MYYYALVDFVYILDRSLSRVVVILYQAESCIADNLYIILLL